jgi:hypothetical protein
LKHRIRSSVLLRPAAVVVTLAGSLQPAEATVTLHCNPVENVDAAAATTLCDAFVAALATSARANLGGATLQLDVNNLRPTAINVTLNMTNAKGDSHTINRALSANDTRITPAMQDAFLQKLISTIPVDF